MMKILTLLFFLLNSVCGIAQIRAFDNSKAILPWMYNPSANFTSDIQAYAGYDGRNNNSFMPQSFVAGIRMPIFRASEIKTSGTLIGVQVMSTIQDLFKSSVVNANFAHQISLSGTFKLAFGIGGGIYSMRFNHDDLIYYDQQDPLLNSGENSFNIHLNAGFSLTMNEKLFINVASPYLVKDHRANISEVILRVGYLFPVSTEINVIAAANLDTYNHNLTFGGDIRAEWRKTVSLLAGADINKYHGGVLLYVKPFSLGYTYGLNFTDVIDHIPSHQISMFTNIPF